MNLLALLASLLLASQAAAAPVFKIGCVATYDTTAAVPVIYGGWYPYPDSVVVFKTTIDYDSRVARFRYAENLGNGWAWFEAFDRAEPEPCSPPSPFRRVTIMAGAADPCGTTTLADPVLWIRFGRTGYGTSLLEVPGGECNGLLFTEAFNCLANRTEFPEYLGGGCVVFGNVSDVSAAPSTGWSRIKGLYR